MSTKPTIGFIGLGIMGKPMARNLLKAGYPLVVHTRKRATVDELVAEGAKAGSSPRDVAAQSDVVITMLPDSPDVEEVVLGKDGVAEGIKPGAIYVDMSTIAPASARRVAETVGEKGAQALDAPVSGGEKGAIEATLSIMAGGPQGAFDAVEPIFKAMGKNIVLVGPSGAGQIAKAANQLVVGVTIEAVAEALALAEAAGVDPAKVRSVLLGGFAQSRILDLHGQRMLEGNFQPGFKSRLHQKDMRIVDQTARESGLDAPAAKLALDRFTALVEGGGGERDHSALRTLLKAKEPATR
ncbi:MAG: 2-hydroxy-3-oxopropionate reductase [Candidatus Eremiobacteraeota bacterium]|nr:2-hydroxy-3-oxopropionate reductase [Candidatus Eremiobacteraeota bacterium]